MTQSEPNAEAISKRPAAMRIVHRYMGVSAVAGLITVPVLDVAALGGVHITLIKDLSEFYGVEFSEHAARNILVAVAASLLPGAIGSVLGRKALRVLPFVSHAAGLLTMSAFSAAVSYALGRVVIRHFEAGGSLDSFNPEHLSRLLFGSTTA